MLDFNGAEPQGTGAGASAIPEDSIVCFKMEIRAPKAGKESDKHALLCKSPKGNDYIDVEFVVYGGSFEGRKVWQNFTLFGSEKAAQISMRTLRAIVESARGIKADDQSPQACEGRKLSDWADFNSMAFLAKVGTVVEQSQKDGNYYVNNTIKRIITPDEEEYARGEFISDKPLPTIPEPGTAPVAKAAAASATPAWGSTTAAPAAAAPKAATGSPMPAWASR